MTPPQGGPRPVLLVVDTGVDDALAILAAHRHPGLHLVGVVAAAGNVSLARAAANSRAVLDLLGCPAPLLRGAAVRTDGRSFGERAVHGPDGLAGLGPPRPLTATETAALPALDAAMLRELERHASRHLQVVCLAPLTSLAGLPVSPVLASYARPGQANHTMDPDAADRLVAGALRHLACDGAPPDLPEPIPRTDGVAGLGLALLEHQRGRRAGLGDAAGVLRLAGAARPGRVLLGLLTR